MVSSLPIGIVDTGAGGLSVVAAIKRLLPHEDIHYFADTAHLPYGIKSPELIKLLGLKMVKRLVEISPCKMLVVACHTISVTCLDDLKQELNIPVVGMVEPSILGLKRLLSEEALSSVAILSTRATVNSQVYRKAWPVIDEASRSVLLEHASGPLVSLVEEGELSDLDLKTILNHFLPDSVKLCDALLIGCTHFSALAKLLGQVQKPGCRIVDAAEFAASFVASALEASMQFSTNRGEGLLRAYVSDNPERFQIIARRFIEGDLAISLIQDYVRS